MARDLKITWTDITMGKRNSPAEEQSRFLKSHYSGGD